MARKHKIQKALTHLVQAIIRFAQKLTSRNTYRFLRTAFVTSRRRLQAGFVLPTTTLLIIVMILVVSTLMFRSYQRSTDVISEYQRQQVQNAAAPAIERAKAKLEKLFSKSLVAGIPSEDVLEKDLVNPDNDEDYLFPDETRLTMTAGGGSVPAWRFQVNDNITVAYTILLRTSRPGVGTMDPDSAGALTSDEDKANALLVRNGPLISGRTDNPLCQGAANDGEGQILEEGWFAPTGSSSLQKNFQVFAVAIPTGSSNSAISTLQYQQDRYMDRGNKWGAWFRTDLELFPGPKFVWNGAMHTQGSFFVRAQKGFDSFLISSKDSCFYNPALNSDITTAQHLVYSIPSLPTANGKFGAAVNFDLHEGGSAPEIPPSVNLNAENLDSVTGNLNNAINIALDPVEILTSDLSVNRSTAGWDEDPNWENGDLTQRITIKNPACPPYVDDTYRADNRYGPKPSYSQAVRDPENPGTNCAVPVGEGGFNYGQPINNDLLTRNTPPVDQPTGYGLDGYWERRSRGEGLRVIVGQRLELGNPFGWVQDRNRDGDYDDPVDKKPGDDPLNPDPLSPSDIISHQQRQRRTLRDNLAAVQSTAVYFHSHLKGDLPVGFVATTVHPGSEKTLKDSATFDRIRFASKPGEDLPTAQGIIATDFFNGRGTNGIEFEELPGDISNSAARVKALRNLANFAGEWKGAYPPIWEDNKVHPDRELTMWGNHSNLRRIFYDFESWAALSPADKTTLETASGTLGMLAYNIRYLQAYDYANNANRTTGLNGTANMGLNDLADELWQLFDSGTLSDHDPPEAYIAQLEELEQTGAVDPEIVKLARFVMTKEQVERDRENGFFVREYDPLNQDSDSISEDLSDALYLEIPNGDLEAQLTADGLTLEEKDEIRELRGLLRTGVPMASDLARNENFGLSAALGGTDIPAAKVALKRLIGLSRLCSTEPKFPSLYYIFPTVNHNHDGTVGGPEQPATEPYINDPDIQQVNGVVDYESLNESDIRLVSLRPRDLITTWRLPIDDPITTFNPAALRDAAPNASNRELIKIVDGATEEFRKVAFKDSALYDGREAMNVRVLNIDLDMLRTKNAPGGENWLPESGIVYAFREDAVREDAIARDPEGVMRAYGLTLTDPAPVALPAPASGFMSTKSVDYYPDPERRPYGFRLKNGSTLRRQGNLDNPKGMTFVSDNPVYIQGSFNLHHNAAGGTENTLQEFTKLLGGTPRREDFYNRTANQLNPNFANPETDWWRPTEIMADAVTILSNNFCDGTIEDGIIYAGVSNPNGATQLNGAARERKYGCARGSDYTSYLNQNRPLLDSFNGPWMSENRFDPPTDQSGANNSAQSPIMIAPSGDPVYCPGTDCTDPANWRTYRLNNDPGTYLKFIDGPAAGKRHINAADTTVNMVMVSGVIPQRLNQINGGFHNFPRLLENWNQPAKNLFIQGSLIQLNFSNYATGPFSQNAWEPEDTPVATVNPFNYYQPPNRNWGYDVGLQYAPAGPISERMIVPNTKRDEFYREPKADDPYICQLREAIGSGCN